MNFISQMRPRTHAATPTNAFNRVVCAFKSMHSAIDTVDMSHRSDPSTAICSEVVYGKPCAFTIFADRSDSLRAR